MYHFECTFPVWPTGQDTEFTQIQLTTIWDKEKQERQKETANNLTDGNIL